MEKVVFAQSWQSFFAELGLKSFVDFFSFSDERLNESSKREVQMLTFGEDANTKKFFLKRFFYSHLKDTIFTMRNFGLPCSQAASEWENANLLLDNGIGTYQPVCYGEQTIFGLERKSFLLTEKIEPPCLADFVDQNWSRMAREEKEKLIIALAKMIRKMHNAKISMPDLYIWHIFVDKKEDGDYDFAIIDLHRMKQNITSQSEKIKNLGRLNYSMLDKYFDQDLRRLLIESYAEKDDAGVVAVLVKKVKKYTDTLLSKRNQKPY